MPKPFIPPRRSADSNLSPFASPAEPLLKPRTGLSPEDTLIQQALQRASEDAINDVFGGEIPDYTPQTVDLSYVK